MHSPREDDNPGRPFFRLHHKHDICRRSSFGSSLWQLGRKGRLLREGRDLRTPSRFSLSKNNGGTTLNGCGSTPSVHPDVPPQQPRTGTASVSLPPDTNTAEAEGPGCKNPNLNKTNGDQRANCHGLFTEGRDAGHTSPHPVITAGTAEKGEYNELSEDRADRVSPRIRRSRFLQTHHPALCRGNSLGAVYCVGLDIQTGNAGFARAGDVAAPSFRSHQPNLNNPARCVVYAAGYRTGDAPKSVRAYDGLHRPVLSFAPSAEACSFPRQPGWGKFSDTAAIISRSILNQKIIILRLFAPAMQRHIHS